MNVKEKARNAVMTVKKKALPVMASASMAMSAVAVNAFAADGSSSTSLYSTIADSFKSGMSDCAQDIALIFAAVLPLGIGIVGMYAAFGAGKKIFMKLTH